MRGLAIYGVILFGLSLIHCIFNLALDLGYKAGNSIVGLVVSIPILTFCVLYLWKGTKPTKRITKILKFLASYNIIMLGIIIISGIYNIIFNSEHGRFLIIIGLSVSVPILVLCHRYFWEETQKEAKKHFATEDKEKNVTSNKRGTWPTENEILNLQETNSRYRFWSRTQRVTLFLFPVLFVMCFFWNWWLLIPALLFLVLNVVAYIKKMKSLGRNPTTRNIDEVV